MRQRWAFRMVPPVRTMVDAPVGASSTAPAPQPVTAGGVELLTFTPPGRLSVIETLVRSVSLGAKKSIRNLELPPAVMVEGENDFTPETFVLATVTLAFAGNRFP